jgi:hypothetical protein
MGVGHSRSLWHIASAKALFSCFDAGRQPISWSSFQRFFDADF